MIWRAVLLALLAYLCAGIQWAWEARSPRFAPELTILSAILAGILVPRSWATPLGGFAGLLRALAAGQGAALMVIVHALVAFGLGTSERVARLEDPWRIAGLTFAFTFAVSVVRMLVLPGATVGIDIFSALFGALINGVLIYPLLLLLRRLSSRNDREVR